jgi:hypothetical protein
MKKRSAQAVSIEKRKQVINIVINRFINKSSWFFKNTFIFGLPESIEYDQGN